jgi:Holliday junction DNA helicase RuvB
VENIKVCFLFPTLYLCFSVKNPNLDPTDDFMTNSEKEFEKAMRPQGFFEFQGQDRIVDNLKVFIAAAKQRGEALITFYYTGLPV